MEEEALDFRFLNTYSNILSRVPNQTKYYLVQIENREFIKPVLKQVDVEDRILLLLGFTMQDLIPLEVVKFIHRFKIIVDNYRIKGELLLTFEEFKSKLEGETIVNNNIIASDYFYQTVEKEYLLLWEIFLLGQKNNTIFANQARVLSSILPIVLMVKGWLYDATGKLIDVNSKTSPYFFSHFLIEDFINSIPMNQTSIVNYRSQQVSKYLKEQVENPDSVVPYSIKNRLYIPMSYFFRIFQKMQENNFHIIFMTFINSMDKMFPSVISTHYVPDVTIPLIKSLSEAYLYDETPENRIRGIIFSGFLKEGMIDDAKKTFFNDEIRRHADKTLILIPVDEREKIIERIAASIMETKQSRISFNTVMRDHRLDTQQLVALINISHILMLRDNYIIIRFS
jgi:hypothetical protein